MTKSAGAWVQEAKCWNCDKTGKEKDPNDPEKEIKCHVCGGTGYIMTKGTLSS